jgi:hypothetical protein
MFKRRNDPRTIDDDGVDMGTNHIRQFSIALRARALNHIRSLYGVSEHISFETF